jgi:peptidyl-prolyl cis-trans isomerase A (cyclophilin A)
MGDVTPNQTAVATLHTNHGDIRISLFGNHAPKTVRNFVGLADGTAEYTTANASGGTSGPFYDGAVFHRVMDGFMFHPELRFDRGYLLAMANAGPGTNGSQFFITVGPQPHLNRKHTIFGEVVDPDSRKVVDSIATTAADRNDRPKEAVVISKISIE